LAEHGRQDDRGDAPRISYAQNGEDVRLSRALGGVEKGFYVEVGGWDPEIDSVSRAFYETGWSGIVVEPVHEYAEGFRTSRPRDQVVECLAGPHAQDEVEMTVFPGTGLSTSVPAVAGRHVGAGLAARVDRLAMRTLDEILATAAVPDEIHFLMVDVEGAEADVLRGLSLERTRPWVLVIEATEPRSTTPSHDAWESSILEHGYQFVVFDGLNRFYVADEHADLADALVLAPNQFDHYISVHHANALAALEGANRELLVMAARMELLLARLAAGRQQVADVEAERDRALAELDGCRDELAGCRRELAESRGAAGALQGQVQAMLASRSWRLTKPLRSAIGNG
jgi:FkbM family methyltransferase